MDKVYFYNHQGLGDHLACCGLYRHIAAKSEICVIPVAQNYVSDLNRMMGDLGNVILLPLISPHGFIKMKAIGEILKKFKFEIIRLGYFGNNFRLNPNMRCDENFYLQADIPHSIRWDKFHFIRNLEKEMELKDLLIEAEEPYIFLHEDVERKFLVQRKYLNPGMKIISPRLDLRSKYTIFDYVTLIENAVQIHCIESSFSVFIDNIDVEVPKYIHRYARPEAKTSYTYEFTYKSAWTIVQ